MNGRAYLHFPPDAVCDDVDCGHPRDRHVHGDFCIACAPLHRYHPFVPRRLAGGTYTPKDEREAYERARRGE